MPSRTLVTLAAAGLAAAGASASTLRQTSSPLTVTITNWIIGTAKHTATFDYKATGGSPTSAVTFVCKLAYDQREPKTWSHCAPPPKSYRSMASGTYIFMVKALASNGQRSNIATHDFSMP